MYLPYMAVPRQFFTALPPIIIFYGILLLDTTFQHMQFKLILMEFNLHVLWLLLKFR